MSTPDCDRPGRRVSVWLSDEDTAALERLTGPRGTVSDTIRRVIRAADLVQSGRPLTTADT